MSEREKKPVTDEEVGKARRVVGVVDESHRNEDWARRPAKVWRDLGYKNVSGKPVERCERYHIQTAIGRTYNCAKDKIRRYRIAHPQAEEVQEEERELEFPSVPNLRPGEDFDP